MTRAYLTIDDTPSSYMVDKLDILDELGIKAIFFCEGVKIQKRTEMVKKAIKRGHIIGNHSWSHKRFSRIDKDRGEEEILRTEKSIEKVYEDVGVAREHKFFRFPYGDKGNRGSTENKEFYQEILRSNGYHLPLDCFEWSNDRDWLWTLNDASYEAESLEDVLGKIKNHTFDTGTEVIIYHDHENTHEWFSPFVKELQEHVSFENPSEL